MSFTFRLLLCLLLLAPLGAQERRRARIWLAGQEAGESVTTVVEKDGRRTVSGQEELRLERLGTTIAQTVIQTAVRERNGDEHYTWSLRMSEVPMEGEAWRRASAPRKLDVRPQGGEPRILDIPEGALIWPEEIDQRLRQAARNRQPVRMQTFEFSIQQWTPLSLNCEGPAPLPGHPDAVRFRGVLQQGPMELPVESWISPTEGELKQVASFAGIPLVFQREDLPAPGASANGQGFFAQTLQELPPHPFLYWLDSVDLRWNGKEQPRLPLDPQQQRVEGIWRLRRAALPSATEALDRPVKGKPSEEDRPYLVATPLAQHQDPCFANLEARLHLKPGATRWEITRAVTQTVFEWIREKDMSVGFASALEVCRNAKGDCTEHGVLAVALLRRLGVPARGVLGWVGLETTLGLHFWVEAKIGGRWIPVDPTFCQAPASALRIKLGTTDLADLGSVGWDQAATAFAGGQWQPAGRWIRDVKATNAEVSGPGLPRLRLPGATWSLRADRLEGTFEGQPLRAKATIHPSATRLDGARVFQGGVSGLRGHYRASEKLLWIALPEDRWLELEGLDLGAALKVLDAVKVDP